MTLRQFLKAIGSSAALAVAILMGISILSPKGQASGDDNDRKDEASEIRKGFAIAPVPLNLEGKNRALVGLGSYIVNSQGDCNGCHSAGPQSEYTPTGNPYLLSPPFSGKEHINPATYLGGGRDFGPYPGLAHLYSRNLTPDKSGLPAGGMTY